MPSIMPVCWLNEKSKKGADFSSIHICSAALTDVKILKYSMIFTVEVTIVNCQFYTKGIKHKMDGYIIIMDKKWIL